MSSAIVHYSTSIVVHTTAAVKGFSLGSRGYAEFPL